MTNQKPQSAVRLKTGLLYVLGSLSTLMCVGAIAWMTASTVTMMESTADREIEMMLASAQERYALTLGVSTADVTVSIGDNMEAELDAAMPGGNTQGDVSAGDASAGQTAGDSSQSGTVSETPDDAGDETATQTVPDWAIVDDDGTLVYIVQYGDTLTKISGMTLYSVDELAEYNHIRNANLIRTGEAIRIPG